MLAELLVWKKLVDGAEFNNEPLYVTEEEWTELKARFGSEPSSTTPLSSIFLGKPVVIDAVRALGQRRQEVFEDLLDVLRRDHGND